MIETALFDLTGQVAVVSGAASGMGRAASLALSEHGAVVALVDRDADGLARTASDISDSGRRAIAVSCDISDVDQVRGLFERLDRETGRVDFLANVAGEGILAAPEEITVEQVKEVLQNLVVGRFVMCQEAGRRMIAAGKGSIVNIGSLASITALGRGHIAYSMAMGAVAQMTRELSTEWAALGARVNAILPAQVWNKGLEQRGNENPALRDKWLSGIPAGRFGQPDDIRGLMVFLASDASDWVTGALIPMDGGNLALNGGGSVRRPG